MGLLTGPVVAAGSMAAVRQPEIVGDAVMLRPWRPGDQQVVLAGYADPDIQRWHPPRALEALAAWVFPTVGLYRLQLSHSTANPGSCRVADKAGFAAEGTKRGEGWHA